MSATAGNEVLRSQPTEEPDFDRLHRESREVDIIACADAVIAACKALDYLTLRGAELAEGAVRKAFIDAAVDIQKARQRLDREVTF